jgi:hypothetical protein
MLGILAIYLDYQVDQGGLAAPIRKLTRGVR